MGNTKSISGTAARKRKPPRPFHKLTMETLNLSRKVGPPFVTLANARLAAKFCPMLSPEEILEWLEDPVLLDLPAEIPFLSFQLTVPVSVEQRLDGRISFPTTLSLPNDKRVACRQQGGVTAGATLTAAVPLAALHEMGQWSVAAYVQLEHAPDRSRLPILQSDLSRVLPALPADHLLPEGSDICAVCSESVVLSSVEPLRRLPCAHYYHARCIDPWLTGHERTCPTCRAVVLPELPAVPDASWLSAGVAAGPSDETGVDAMGELEGREDRFEMDRVQSDYQAALTGQFQIDGVSMNIVPLTC